MLTDSEKTKPYFEKPIKRGVQRRLGMFGLVICGSGIATAIVLTALSDNLEYFQSPTDVQANIQIIVETQSGQTGSMTGRFRLGGMVSEGSYKRKAGTLEHRFKVTDFSHEVEVIYQGALPDLFREGQGVVAVGGLENLDEAVVFVADEVLAKHDENYMPPEVAAALNRASEGLPRSDANSGGGGG